MNMKKKPSERIKEIIEEKFGDGTASPEEANRMRIVAILEYLDEESSDLSNNSKE